MTALQECICKALDELDEAEFKVFKLHLRLPVNLEGQQPIAKGKLAPADRPSTTDLIVQTYTNHAAKIMENVLEKMGDQQLLLEKFQNMSQGADPPQPRHRPMETDSLPSSARRAVPTVAEMIKFVDDHEKVLTARVNMVAPILDLLYEDKVITKEGRAEVTAQTTTPKKMRELYLLLNNETAKVSFYKGLKENEVFLLKELIRNQKSQPSSDEVDHSNRDRTSKEYSETHNKPKKQPGTLEDNAKSGGAAASGSWLDTGAEQQDEPYVMESDPRGYCLILETVENREGTEHDSSRLLQVFSWLGFKVMRCQNKTAADMGEVLQFFAELNWQKLLELEVKQWSGTEFTNLEEQLPQHGDCFVCCILSHGKEKGICGTDGEIISILDIISPFSGIKCKALLGKPKVFFIQACRGGEGQKQTDVLLDGGVETSVKLDYSLPEFSDFLVAFSTINLYAAARQSPDVPGSWYIRALCDELEKGCKRGDSVDIILNRVTDVVCKELGNLNGADFKQSPDSMRIMRKSLFFRPL